MSGEQVEGDVAMADQTTYLCLRRENETLYLPWSAIKCVRGPVLPDRSAGRISFPGTRNRSLAAALNQRTVTKH